MYCNVYYQTADADGGSFTDKWAEPIVGMKFICKKLSNVGAYERR